MSRKLSLKSLEMLSSNRWASPQVRTITEGLGVGLRNRYPFYAGGLTKILPANLLTSTMKGLGCPYGVYDPLWFSGGGGICRGLHAVVGAILTALLLVVRGSA